MCFVIHGRGGGAGRPGRCAGARCAAAAHRALSAPCTDARSCAVISFMFRGSSAAAFIAVGRARPQTPRAAGPSSAARAVPHASASRSTAARAMACERDGGASKGRARRRERGRPARRVRARQRQKYLFVGLSIWQNATKRRISVCVVSSSTAVQGGRRFEGKRGMAYASEVPSPDRPQASLRCHVTLTVGS